MIDIQYILLIIQNYYYVMLEKVKEKMASWKKALAEQCDGIDPHSDWEHILHCLRHQDIHFSKLWADVLRQCGNLSENERQALNTLPYFKEFMDLLPVLSEKCYTDFFIYRDPNGNVPPIIPQRSLRNFFLLKLRKGDAIHLSLHRRDDDVCQMYDININIVRPGMNEYDIFVSIGNSLKTKNISIRYTNVIDERWIKAENEN